MSRLRDYRPIEYRQVCAIARSVLLRDPALSDADWKAGIRDLAAKQGWDEPPPDMLARAMSAVERALMETIGPRLTAVEVAPRPETDSKPPLTPKEWKAFADTLKRVVERSAAQVPQNVRTIARETLEISEPAALDQFYRDCETDDRVTVLRRYAEPAITRPADWDYADVRARAKEHRLCADACFGCRRVPRGVNWHHVIQIQYGGSNYLRNRVALCDDCHAAVHPWLPKAGHTTLGNWWSFGKLAPAAGKVIDQSREEQERRNA